MFPSTFILGSEIEKTREILCNEWHRVASKRDYENKKVEILRGPEGGFFFISKLFVRRFGERFSSEQIELFNKYYPQGEKNKIFIIPQPPVMETSTSEIAVQGSEGLTAGMDSAVSVERLKDSQPITAKSFMEMMTVWTVKMVDTITY